MSNQENKDDIEKSKSIEFYSASINAWLNTKLEHDKSLLTLSAGGISILVTILTTVGSNNSTNLILFFLAILCFLVCLLSVLATFNKNSSHLEKIISGNPQGDDSTLKFLDKLSNRSFIVGVLFSAIIGISTAINTYIKKEIEMAKEPNNSEIGIGMDSFEGFGRLSPDQQKQLRTILNQNQTQPPQNQVKGATSDNKDKPK